MSLGNAGTEAPPVIRMRNVTHSLSQGPVLADITATLDQRRIGVIGANGSGKSTFARLLNGLIVPSQGTVEVDGFDTGRQGKKVRNIVGFVFQSPENQIVFPIVEEDVAFGLKNLKLSREEIEGRVDAVLSRYELEHLRSRATHILSGGEKQLLAIAGVMCMRPRLVVFDEPTTLLDLRNRNTVAKAIFELDQSVVMVTHDLDLLTDYDRVLVLDEGRIVADDLPPAAIEAYRKRMGA